MDAMDMMAAVEEEKRLRELQDLHDAIVLDDAYFTKRNLSGRGRNIVPSGKQKRDLQAVSMNIRFGPALSRRRSTGSIGNHEDEWGEEDSNKFTGELDLTAKPRVFLYSGMLTQYDPGKSISILHYPPPPPLNALHCCPLCALQTSCFARQSPDASSSSMISSW